MSTVFAKIQMRRGTAAEWAASNPVLAQGEMAFETDTGITKIGDGGTAYASLPAYATYDQMLEAQQALEEAAVDVAAVAANKVSAAASAATATTKAGEASASAAAALASEQAAEVKAQEAEQARVDAIAYAGVAGTKADEIVASAEAAAADAAAADADRIAAEAARAGAEAAQGIAEGAAAAALASEDAALASAEQATGAAAQSLAIYGSVDAQNAAIATAQAQASLAAGYAASAASVAQQDLSAVIAQALHRSPNAITSMFIYDTSKDSDGGAWTEKCQHTSWWNEAINGKWLGAQDSEFQARNNGATVSATELVANGDFASNISNWTAANLGSGAVPAWSSNFGGSLALPRVDGNNNARVYQNFATVSGKTYRVTFDVKTSDGVIVGVGTTNAGTEILATTNVFGNRTTSFVFVATGTTSSLSLRGQVNGATAYVDNISVREVTAVTTQTGDYFQLSTDGRFYRLNAGSGTTEVFRGNKRDFPRLAGIVAEAASVTIYDLTEPGRPMWMRFIGGLTGILTAAYGLMSSNTYPVNGMAASNGALVVGSYYLHRFNFISENQIVWGGAPFERSLPISQRNLLNVWAAAPVASYSQIASANVNAVAMTVLPDAPVDPVTGLRVPTIAVATGGGVSVIKHNGTVVNSSITNAAHNVDIKGTTLYVNDIVRYPYFATNVGSLGASFALTNYGAYGQAGGWFSVLGKTIAASRGQQYGWLNFNGNRVFGAKTRENAPLAGLGFIVGNNFNTGWMTGDIRRAYLSDVGAGSLTGPELVTNGDFSGGSTGWTLADWVISSGQATATATSTSLYGGQFTPVANRVYRVEFDVVSYTSGILSVTVGGNFTSNVNLTGAAMAPGRKSVVVVAGASPARAVEFYGGAISATIDNISVREVVADRSYKAQGASINGTLTKAELASGTSLVAYSGWSAANYLREPYSADLDFGTGEWTASAWVNVPATLPASSFPVIGSELVTNGGFDSDTAWTKGTGWTISGGVATHAAGVSSGITQGAATAGKSYKVTWTVSGWTAGTNWALVGGNAGPGWSGNGTFTSIVTAAAAQGIGVACSATFDGSIDNISIVEVGAASLFDRAATTGARIRLGMTGTGLLTAEASDGTTTRTVTTSAAYNTATWLKARVNYTTDGTLAISVNGREVAATRGAPLLTLNNASAVLTIGNSFALDAPFPGSIDLLKLGATVPTPEQAVFMYEQEKQLFRAGALSVLPDSGALVDMAYDDATDRWVAVSAANESYWTGLVRNSVQAVPAGSFTRVAAGSGVELAARSTTNPGVDVTIPAYGLREELVRRAEAAARLSKELAVYDFVGGFTANTSNGSAAITSVAGLTYPGSLIGARVSGSGIPANTRIVGVSGTTIYLSATATATATGVSVSFLDFNLPVGLEAKAVLVGGALKQEGSTKDFTRLFDGFLETIRFGTAPGATAWVQIQATKGTVQ